MALEWRNVLKRKQEIFSKIFPGCVISVFDNETTGLNSEAKIIQFSAMKFILNKDLSLTKIDEIDLYINPEEKLKPKIVEITGITDEMLENCLPETKVYNEIFEFLENSDVIAAYNISFDLRMLSYLGNRVGYLFDQPPEIDILEMARDLISNKDVEDHKLGNVTNFMFPDNTIRFHSAIEDVEATSKVMEMLFKGYCLYEKKYKNIDKSPIHLERAGVFINEHKKSQQRLVMTLNVGNPGDIFYDIVGKTWSHKSDTKSKKLFDSIDLNDLENQFMKKYAYCWGYKSIDDVAKAWLKYKREKSKVS